MTELPQCHDEHVAWLAKWRPIWAEQLRTEKRIYGRWLYENGYEIDACTSDAVREGWQRAEDEFREWCSEADALYRPFSGARWHVTGIDNIGATK